MLQPGCGLDGVPAPLVVPDPRWFALHKYWLTEKPARDSLEKPKDRSQAEAVWHAVRENMPHLPIDARLADELPAERSVPYAQLQATRRL